MSDPSDAPVCRWLWREVDAAPCSCGGVSARLVGELILGWLRALIPRRSHEDPGSPAPLPRTASPPLWYLECFVERERRLLRFPIDPLPFRVGRSPSLALVLSSESVSRAHAELFVGDGELHLRDLGSKNGTFVNRERVQEAPLQEGDIIRFTDTEFYLGRHDTDHGSADCRVPRSLLAKVRSAPRAQTERQPPPPDAGPPLMPAALPGRAVNLVCSECNQLFRIGTGFGVLGRLLCASCALKLVTELKHRSLQLLPLGTPADDPTAPTDDPTVRSADPTVTNDSPTVATLGASNPLVKQFRRGGVPRDIRLMAAQGLVPLKPEDLLELWTVLVSDTDEAVRTAADGSLTAFPVPELLPIVKNGDTPVVVLAWAVNKRTEPELREAALQNHSLPDEVIEHLAPTLPQALAELVVINQTRLLRRTSLLVALEGNAGLNNDQKRRLRELRETFRVGRLEAALPAVASKATPEEQNGPEPELAPEGELVMTEDEAIVHYLSEDDRQKPEKVRVVQRIYRLSAAEKIITALKGSRQERAILIRDPNRLVATAVLGSPRITEAEIESISAMTDVSDEILRTIGNHREWTKRYAVLNNLVRNPRTPTGIVLSMVPRLNPRDVKGVAVGRDRRGHDPKSPGFSPEERELLVRLSGLFVKVNRSFGALVDRLTGEQREAIEAAFERARTALREGVLNLLRSSVEELQKARRLLEELSEPSQSSATPRAGASERRPGPSEPSKTRVAEPSAESRPATPQAASERGPAPSESSTDTPWSTRAVELYRDLVRARLSEGRCTACGVSLAAALLVRTHTSVGPELNELGLSDEGAARYLAATDDLVVQCGQCGAQNEIPSQRTAND